MCGRFNITDSALVHGLMDILGVDTSKWPVRFSDYHRACSTISIVKEADGKRIAQDATWWLLLEPAESGFKPSRYTSFNTRHDKLNTPRSAGYKAYRETRCIIPASGFGETEYETVNGKKKPKFYHNFQGYTMALALGGLYREWHCRETGEITTSCSVVTLPPHPKLAPYHSKASPLLIPQDGNWIDRWLNPSITEPAEFELLLRPRIPSTLQAQRINKLSERKSVGDSFFIELDTTYPTKTCSF